MELFNPKSFIFVLLSIMLFTWLTQIWGDATLDKHKN